jgi:hypothetical protein
LGTEICGEGGVINASQRDDEEEVLMTEGALIESLCLNPYGYGGIRYREEFFQGGWGLYRWKF